MSIGILVFLYGEQVESSIRVHFGMVTLVTGAELILAMVAWGLLQTKRKIISGIIDPKQKV